jgi:cyclase
MVFARLIPTMLLSKGRLVKGCRFHDHEDAGHPAMTAKIYNDQMADEVLVLDIDATPEGKPPNIAMLKELASRCFVPIAFGGGISDTETAATVLSQGADKFVINSAALARPQLIEEAAVRFGRQAVVVAIDFTNTKAGPRVATACGTRATDLHPVEWAKSVESLGAGEILITCVEREGTRTGLDIDTTRNVAEAVSIPVIAHGGVGGLEDFVAAFKRCGASAVAAGRTFQFADNNLIKVRRYMQQNGIELRRL